MSKDKRKGDAKKMVREETERTKRSDARRQKPEKRGGFGDLFENMWRDLEDHEDSKKADKGRSLGRGSARLLWFSNPV